MKTPINELIEYMDLIAVPKELDKDIQSALTQFHTHLMYKINELLEKEKQMIIDAYKGGCIESGFLASDLAKDYYNETFNQ